MQPATIMFKVAGVDEERGVFPGGFEESFDLPTGIYRSWERSICQSLRDMCSFTRQRFRE